MKRTRSIPTLIGGQTCHPSFLGNRKLRKASTDVDTICQPEEIIRVIGYIKKDSPFYVKKYDQFLAIYDGIPVGISLGVHNFMPPDDFFKRRAVITINGLDVRVCCAEYTILMKLMRANEKKRLFGKDAIDIGNLILGNKNNPRIDVNFLADIIRHYLSERYVHRHIGEIRERE